MSVFIAISYYIIRKVQSDYFYPVSDSVQELVASIKSESEKEIAYSMTHRHKEKNNINIR